MSQQARHYRVIEKGGKTFVADLDGNPLPPSEAKRFAQSIAQTAETKTYVYIGFRESDGLYKIGRTNNLDRRKGELGIEFKHTIECDLYGEYSSSQVESALHGLLKIAGTHIEGEWFDLGQWGADFLEQNCNDARTSLAFANQASAIFQKINEDISEVGMDVFAMLVDELWINASIRGLNRRCIIYTLDVLRRKSYKDGDVFMQGYHKAIFDLVDHISQDASEGGSGKYTKFVDSICDKYKEPAKQTAIRWASSARPALPSPKPSPSK